MEEAELWEHVVDHILLKKLLVHCQGRIFTGGCSEMLMMGLQHEHFVIGHLPTALPHPQGKNGMSGV